jgi:hypothetical protein
VKMMSQRPLVRNQSSQPTSGPSETRRRSVVSRGESGDDAFDVSAVTGVDEEVLEKWFWRKISIVWPMVRSVRQASGMVGRPIRRETTGL